MGSKTNLKNKLRFCLALCGMILLVAMATILPSASFAQDPGGVKTGNLGDIDTAVVKVLDTVSKAKDTSIGVVRSNISRLTAAVFHHWGCEWP
jgi:hypothetical protein